MLDRKRREFITLLGSAAVAWPLSAPAQQGERVRRVGVLMNPASDDPEAQGRIAAFRQELQQLGWTEGRDVRIDYRWRGTPVASTDMLRSFWRSRQTSLWPRPPRAFKHLSRTVPIVFAPSATIRR
jgi:putative tryptophan/tyrosine transport system substrate-binding protein